MSATAVREPVTRLAPLERLEALCDPGSLQIVRSRVSSARLGARAEPGDGVLGATGLVAGRPVACYAQDGRFLGGSLGERHADTIVRVLQTAGRARIPVVAFVESGGARMQEGTAALAGYGRIFRETVALSGLVPQISVVSGASAGGGAYSPALTDLIVMTDDAAMFLTGPGVVREALGEQIDAAGLGGPRVHERNGVCHLVEPDEPAAAGRVRELLGYLPRCGGRAAARREPSRRIAATRAPRCRSSRGSPTTSATRWRGIVDAGSLLDSARGGPATWSPRWPASTVGRSPWWPTSRAISAACSMPRAPRRPRGSCASAISFGLPLVVLVDTPGFMPGSRQEQAGVIRHGASLVRAFAAARVPKLTVVLRKSYGGAYITMNSRDLGADLVLAWPSSELGIMSARAAVGIVNRRELRAASHPEAERARLADAYAGEHLRADAAAAEGFVDELIEPVETRSRLAGALRTLAGDRG